METVETLLVVLVVILSVLTIVALVVVIVIGLAIRRLLSKAQKIADSSNESLSLLKGYLVEKAGIVSMLRFLLRKQRTR